MSEEMPTPEDQMMQWITSKWITKPIYVATELGIADLLRDGPKSIDALAKETDTQGSFMIQLLANYPHIKGIVADMPGVVVPAKKVIANADLSHRCKAIPFDFLKETPPVCDAFFLVNVMHDWEDTVCCRILKNISRVMKAESRLWIVEYLLEPGTDFSVAKLLDIEVLVMGGGRERNIDEYKSLIDSVGLAVSKVIPTNLGPVMLECAIAK